VRTQTVGNKTIYIIGGRRLDQNFLASLELPEGMRALLYRNLEPTFIGTALTDANGGVPQAETFQSLIEEIQKQPQDLTRTISWNRDPQAPKRFMPCH